MDERRWATDAEAKALASVLRMRILRVCLGDARTNKEIAEAVGRDPASTLHHVRRLVATGFLAPQPERRGNRGSREIPYLATGKSWRLKNPGKDQVLLDAFAEEAALVPLEQIETVRLGLRMSDDLREQFLDELGELLEAYRLRADAEAATPRRGTAWSLFIALHPDPNRRD